MALLVGCSTGRDLDREALEADIADQLVPDHPGLVSRVACPEIAEPSPGDAFVCQATLGEQAVEVDVVLGGTDDELTSTASIASRLVAASEVAALMAATFGDEIGIPTSVDCGQAVRALAAEESLRCDATDPTGVVRPFDVTIGADGLLELSLR